MHYKPSLIALLTASAGVVAASDKPVKITDLPPPVRQSVDKETKGATLRGLSREIENGKVYYEAETTVDGRNRDILFSESGNVVEIEEQVPLERVPAGARTAISKSSARGHRMNVEAG